MSQIILHHTMPGSGTHLTRELLKTHPQISYIKLNTGASIAPLIPCLAQGVIDCTRFDHLLTWVAYTQKDDNDRSRLGVFALLKNTTLAVFSDPLHQSYLNMHQSYLNMIDQTVILYSHIYFRGTGENTGWEELPSSFHISDLLKTGYRTRTITPLRDPVLCLCTMLSRGHTEVVTLHGCKFLNEYPDDLPTFFIPVDLWNKPEYDVTQTRELGKLFEDFLGLKPTSETWDFIWDWPNVNKMNRERRLRKTPDQPGKTALLSIFEVEDRLNEGLDPTGINALVDTQIEEYKKLEGLKALYESYGYRNLCWF